MIENGKMQVMLKVVLWLSPIVVGVALSIGAYRERLDAMQLRVEAIETKVQSNEMSIAIITRDIVYIKETVSRIENKLNSNK
jgi:hypothetical protein